MDEWLSKVRKRTGKGVGNSSIRFPLSYNVTFLVSWSSVLYTSFETHLLYELSIRRQRSFYYSSDRTYSLGGSLFLRSKDSVKVETKIGKRERLLNKFILHDGRKSRLFEDQGTCGFETKVFLNNYKVYVSFVNHFVRVEEFLTFKCRRVFLVSTVLVWIQVWSRRWILDSLGLTQRFGDTQRQ